ncbi:S-layer protein domain-containing protein [Methanomethylovorans sp.]|uniref:S-layer protein domain-containing protein n=1 Tax=Methanomethylovorans sp. TaxID=2758717 RepID=UPI00345E80A4
MRKKIIIMIFILCALAGTTMAEEIRGPVFPAYFNGFSYNISGIDAPSLLKTGEVLKIDTSDGYNIGPKHFKYVGINNGKTVPYLGSEYFIESIDDVAILKQKIWEKDGLTIIEGRPKALSRGYSVLVSDHSKEKDQISLLLRKDGETIDKRVMDLGSQVNFTTEYAGNKIVLFSGSFMGFFDNGDANKAFRISDAKLWDMTVLKDGYSPDGVFVIKLKDVDGDGDIDIVGEIREGRSLDLNSNTVIPIFGNSFFIKTGTFYDSFYEGVEKYDLLAQNKQYKIFGTSGYEDIGDVNSFLQNPPASTIAVGPRVTINTTPYFQEDAPEIRMQYLLRGAHSFYTYIPAQGITLSIGKKDMNNYAGADELKVNICSMEGNVITSMELADDGDTDSSKVIGAEQTASIRIDDVEPGSYRIDLVAGNDLYISTLDISSGKLVAKDSVYLISPGELLATSKHSMDMCFKTYHNAGLQTISILGSDFNRTININATATCFSVNLPYSDTPYTVHIPKGNMIINTNGYLAFSEGSLFDPNACEVLNLQRDDDWIQKNDVDYIVVPASKKQKGFYVYKEVASEYKEESSPSPWTLDRVDTFMSPGMFYFDFDKYHTYEYISLDTTAGLNISEDNFSYTSLQIITLNDRQDITGRDIALLGEPYCVLYIDDEKAILGKRTANGVTTTLSDPDSYKLGAGYSLMLNGIDIKGGQVLISLMKDGVKVHDLIGKKGTYIYYNTSIEGKEVTMLSSRIDSYVRSAQQDTVKLTDLTFRNVKDYLVLENGQNIADEFVLYLKDVNDDDNIDIEIRLQKGRSLYLKENRKTPILGDFAAFEMDTKQKVKLIQNNTLQRSSQWTSGPGTVEEQEELFISWAYPSRNASVQFTKMSIENLELTFEDEIQSAYLVVRQLSPGPLHNITDTYETYRIYNISIVPDNIIEGKIHFKVSNKWLDDQEIDRSSLAVLRYDTIGWERSRAEISTKNNGDVNIGSEIRNSSTIAIVGKKVNNTFQDTGASRQEQSLEKNIDNNNLHISGTTTFAIVTIVSLMAITYMIYRQNDKSKRRKDVFEPSKRLLEEHRQILSFNHSVFSTLFVTMLLLFLMENLWVYTVSAYIDVKYIVYITIISGLIDILFYKEENENEHRFMSMDLILALTVAIIGVFMVGYKLSRATSIVSEVSILSGMLLLTVALTFYDLDLRDLIGPNRKEKKRNMRRDK